MLRHSAGYVVVLCRLLAVVSAGIVLLTAVNFIVELETNDLGRQGFAIGSAGEAIEAVLPRSAAGDAGLRVGDLVLFERMSLQSVLDLTDLDLKLTTRPIHLVIDRSGRIFELDLHLRPLLVNGGYIATSAVSLAATVVIQALVIFALLRVPGDTAIALWALAVPWLGAGLPFSYHSPLWLAIVGVFFNGPFASFASTAGLLILTAHALAPREHRHAYERAALIGAAILALPAAAADTMLIVFRHAQAAALVPINSVAQVAPQVIALGIVVVAFFRVSGVARVRLGWLALAYAAFTFGGVDSAVISIAPAFVYLDWPAYLVVFFQTLGMAALTFAVASSELFGVAFVVNRTAVFATTTALVVGFFAALNWLIGTTLKNFGLTLPVDAVLAGLLGLFLNVIRRRVDRFVDRMFFRKRYDAQARLRRVGRGILHLGNAELVSRTFVDEACAALDLASGAMFRANGDHGSFTRVAALNWGDETAVEIAADDPLIVHVAGSETSLTLDRVPYAAALPHGAARPRVALPLWSGNVLVGIALFGRHLSSAALDPEETAALEAFASAAAAAFDRVGAVELAAALAEIDRLRRELGESIATARSF